MMNQGVNENRELKVEDKNVPRVARQLINQPVNCPWTSRAPLTTTSATGMKNSANEASVLLAPNHLNINTFLFHKRNFSTDATEQSSSQFFHFLRLMQLFPDVHPATLHTVMVLCKNDFFTAVDKLLYAKRCKNICLQRRNLWNVYNRTKMHRHQPYSYTAMPNGCIKVGINNPNQQDVNGMRVGMGSQQSISSTSCSGEECDMTFPSRPLETKRFVYRNRMKSIDAKPGTDLPPVASPQCTLPIRPLSPLSQTPRDLSSTQNEDETAD